MPLQTDTVYLYDGSYEGLLCCVFESYERKEMPVGILDLNGNMGTLFPTRVVATDRERAARVARSIPLRLSVEAEDLVKKAYWSCLGEKEIWILRFLRRGFAMGPRVLNDLTDDAVNAITRAVRHLENEAHLYCGFVRFSEHGGALTAAIEPKNRVLPVMEAHFSERYANETFLIYDKTHKEALVHQNGRHEIVPLAELELPEADVCERYYRQLWKLFYDTIAIQSRTNPRCRMGHMPKRYWGQMTEFQTAAAPEGAEMPAPALSAVGCAARRPRG